MCIRDRSLKDYKKDTGRPLNIYEAALFQWVNPKAWTIAITVASGFMPLEEKLWIAVVFTGVNVIIGKLSMYKFMGTFWKFN